MLLRTRQSVIAVEKTLKYQLNESYAEGYNDSRNEVFSKLKSMCSCDNTYLCIACRVTLIIKGEEL